MSTSTTRLPRSLQSNLYPVSLGSKAHYRGVPAATHRSYGQVRAMADAGIAVVGGGLGGLTFARVMQSKGLDVTVFEREESRESRGQGGVLDLHPESGQWALVQAGLHAEFMRMARPEGQDMRILDKHGKVLWDEVSPPGLNERPEVDRPALRNLLVDSLKPGTIKWDHHVIALEKSGEKGQHVLHFANGASADASVVIGADGARSRVRPLVTDAQPSYTGVSSIEIRVPDVDQSHPRLSRTVGRGSLFALADNKGIIAQRCGDGCIRIYAGFRMRKEGFADLGIHFDEKPDAVKQAIINQFEGWASEITDFVRACDGTFLPRPLYAMPVGVRWPSTSSVALLGDAAHLMSPFAGAGANLAMQDGAELALEFANALDVASAISSYERKMFERADQEGGQSEAGLELCISPDGSTLLAQQMWEYQNPA